MGLPWRLPRNLRPDTGLPMPSPARHGARRRPLHSGPKAQGLPPGSPGFSPAGTVPGVAQVTCTEAYSQSDEQYACHLGCQNQQPFAALRQEQSKPEVQYIPEDTTDLKESLLSETSYRCHECRACLSCTRRCLCISIIALLALGVVGAVIGFAVTFGLPPPTPDDLPGSLPGYLIFRCSNPVYWIYADKKCNGANDCGDCSDEKGALASCPPCGTQWWSCTPVFYEYCTCIPRALCRDRIQHCSDWSDEYACNR
ncbi:Low-density lipoprotein receptor class A domain-containing protein 1 [Chelonia mydas]|uniref:Transmembrane protein 59 n=1 Tax=Chelonia mydas TaxID=8469 RepID=M7B8W4_CHEMY|nr:Low-density lipoprotein receptor class A domain-containing protein 1 [Chelonia mydas]